MSVTSPITRFPNMRMVLKILYDNESFDEEHALDKQFIADNIQKTKATVNNALPMLRAIELIDGGTRIDNKVFLLEKGKIFYEKLVKNNKDDIREYSLKLIKESNSKLYKESLKLLIKEPHISYEDIGRLIRQKIKFKKVPLDKKTYTNIGRTIKDIFWGMEILDIDKDRLRRRNVRGKLIDKLYVDKTISNILKTLKEFDSNNKWKIDTPTQFEIDRENERDIARMLIDFNIAFYHDDEGNILKLTDDGIELKKNLNKIERKKILKAIILKKPSVKEIVKKLIDLDKDFSAFDVGDLISIYNKLNWKRRTRYGHGTNLISWLKEADIIVDSNKKSNYKISDSLNLNELDKDVSIDWSKIGHNEFEDLCCDVLKSLKQFENVVKMGGAPGDLKRDITATERIKTSFDEVEYRKYLVQCKHYIKSKVNPDELPGLINALPTHNADGLLIMTSNELTPNARKYLEDINNGPERYKAKWVEKNKLEELIKNNQKIMNKYF